MEISKRLVFINSASAVATRVLSLTVLLWLQQYLLDRISPEEYSLYPVIMSVMMFAPLGSTILTSGLARYIVEAYACGDDRKVTGIVTSMFPYLLLGGVILLGAGLVFSWNIDHILTITPDRIWDARIMMGLLIFFAALRLVFAPFGVGLYVRQKFVLFNLIQLGTEILRIVFLFLLLFGVSTRVLWVVVAAVVSSLFNLITITVVSRRLIPTLRLDWSTFERKAAKDVISFGSWNFLGRVAHAINTSAAPIILNKLATALDVTCFHLGAMFYRQVFQGWSLVSNPLQPALTAMHSIGSPERLKEAYLRGNRYGLWLVMFPTVPLLVFRKEFIMAYVGSEFIQAATVVGLLLACLPFTFVNVMMWKVAEAKAEMRAVAWRSLTNQVLNLSLTLYLVGRLGMGATGAALSSLIIAAVANPVLNYPIGLKLVGVSFKRWAKETVWLGIAPGMGSAVICLGLRMFFQPTAWASLGAFTALACGVYAFILAFYCFGDYEQEGLRKLIDHISDLFTQNQKHGQRLSNGE